MDSFRTSLRPAALPLGVLLLLTAGSDLAAQRRRERSAPPKLEHVTFDTDRFDSEALGQRVPYGVYLPKGYDDEANAEKRYPLVVWLHGMFEDHQRFQARGGAPVLDRMVGDGSFPEAVFVCAEGSRNSFYINGIDSGRWEDSITEDLIAHVEANYRVRTERHQRVLMGVSMGGYGALKIALRHPQMFGVVAAHSAAVMPRDASKLDERFPWLQRWGGAQRALGQIFGSPIQEEKWRAENVLAIVDELDPKELGGLKLYLDCGDQDRYGFQAPNEELHGMLEDKDVAHTWRLVEGGNHGWRSGYNQKALPFSLAFVAQALVQGRGTSGLEGLLNPGGAKSGGGRGEGR